MSGLRRDAVERLVQVRDDRRRGAGGGEESDPRLNVEARQTGLDHRGHLRQQRRTAIGHHGECAGATRRDCRLRGGHAGEQDLHLVRD